jgi:hypothetical protein
VGRFRNSSLSYLLCESTPCSLNHRWAVTRSSTSLQGRRIFQTSKCHAKAIHLPIACCSVFVRSPLRSRLSVEQAQEQTVTRRCNPSSGTTEMVYIVLKDNFKKGCFTKDLRNAHLPHRIIKFHPVYRCHEHNT